jgi:hypothetical protein
MHKLRKNKKFYLFIFLFFCITVIPLLLALRTDKETRSHGAGSTSLSIEPDSTISAPITKNVGETVSLDLMVDPNSDIVSFIKFEILYDANKLAIDQATGIQINTTAFPVTIEGPVFSSGRIAASVGIGSDPTRGIITRTKFATITFRILQVTPPTQIAFGSSTTVLSIGDNDQASENVISLATPAYIAAASVTNQPIPTTVPGISSSPFPTGIPSPTSILTPIPTQSGPSPTKNPTGFTLILKLLMHGIGSAGDNANLSSSTLSNKNPIHQERNLNVQVVNSDNQIVATKIVPAFYDADQGIFFSNVAINETLPEGEYVVKVKADKYLRKLMPGFFTIKPGEKTTLPSTNMVAGDVNGDNLLNILDYGILYDCGYGAIQPLSMIDPRSLYHNAACESHQEKEHADLNDDGRISGSDYNLFIREISVQIGE